MKSLLAFFLLLAGAVPAQAALQLNWDDFRLFADWPGRFSIVGTTENQRVLSVDPLTLTRSGQVIVTLRTEADPGGNAPFFHRVEIPRTPRRLVLTVRGIDAESGAATTYLHGHMNVDPPLFIGLSDEEIEAGGSFTVNARFEAASGRFPGTWEVEGDRIRVYLEIGCYHCGVTVPTRPYDLTSAPIGNLTPGEYVVEIWDGYGDLELPYLSAPLRVLPPGGLAEAATKIR